LVTLEATIPGNPNHTRATDADAEFDASDSKNLDPWVVAIKLRDEKDVLHTRAYLGNPPKGMEARGLDALPSQLRDAIRNLPKNTAGGGVIFSSFAALRAPELVVLIVISILLIPQRPGRHVGGVASP
jgi:5-methylcytosine-specific restriction enzyme B